MRSKIAGMTGVAGLAIALFHCGGKSFQVSSGEDAAGGNGSGSSGDATSGASAGSAESGRSSGVESTGRGNSGSSGAGSGSSSTGAASGSSGGGSTGSGSSGGASGSSSGGASGSSSGGGSGMGSGSSGSTGGMCGGGASCRVGRSCCGGQCVNTANDPLNCGGCNVKCGPGTYCNGSCQPTPCAKGGNACAMGETCCGASCCTHGQLCCDQQGPISGPYPVCFTPTASQATCAQGCAPLCVSDRNLKRDIEPVDEEAVLQSVARMPVSTWSYKSDDPSVRHLGPMAQDFYAAFGLGDTDRAYNAIDAHGVEMAAIKALYRRIEEQQARIERLERDNRALRSHSSALAPKQAR